MQKHQDEQLSYLWFIPGYTGISLSSLLERAVRICALVLNAQTSGGRHVKIKSEAKKNNIQMVFFSLF